MANSLNQKIGLFVFKFEQHEPYYIDYLIRWQSKLDIDDTHMYMTWSIGPEGQEYKELILGLK